jgi:hypothetical protein
MCMFLWNIYVICLNKDPVVLFLFRFYSTMFAFVVGFSLQFCAILGNMVRRDSGEMAGVLL